MVAIDPDNAYLAADHLRDRASLVRDLDIDIRRAATLADLAAPKAIAACLEIDEELGLLASILSRRADEAAGFDLPGSGWAITSTLLTSLLDNTGERAVITGPLAAQLLLDHADRLTLGGNEPILSMATIRDLAHDPLTTPELAAAAAFFARRPSFISDTDPWYANGRSLPIAVPRQIPLHNLEVFVARNEMLSAIIGGGRGGTIDPSDLSARVSDAELVALGIDPEIYRSLKLPRTHHDVLVAAIEHGTSTHTPEAARSLAFLLPIHLTDGQSIGIGAVPTAAVEHLYDSATRDLTDSMDDFIVRNAVTSHLPETAGGLRNQLFSAGYAEWAAWFNAQTNGDVAPTSPTFGGHNWFHLGVVASDSVGAVIRGEERALGVFAVPDAVRQDIADGNQAIFAHFTGEIASHVRGEPLESRRLVEAFALLAQVRRVESTKDAQHLPAESTSLFALEEQQIVHPYLQLDGAAPLERMGTRGLTFLFDSSQLTSRSAEQVMTDEGELRFEIDGVPIRAPIDIGSPVDGPTHVNNLVDRAELIRRLPSTIDWDRRQADDWADYAQRMPVIVDVAIATLTDPALSDMTEHHRRGHLSPRSGGQS